MSSYNELQIECVICFNKVKKSRNYKLCATCGSSYHKKCLKRWWRKSPKFENICPTCQTKSFYIQRKFCCCF